MPKSGRINEVDLFRFCAAIMVVLYHYAFRGFAADGYSSLPVPSIAAWAKYGYLGVELFFLISGFVILMTASSGSLKKFISSRLVRLFPAFWFCCSLTFVVIMLFGDGRFTASFPQYLANMTMLNEFSSIPSIDGVYWSLAIELQFYFIVALLLSLKMMPRVQGVLCAWLFITALLDVFPQYRLRSIFIAGYAPYFVGGAVAYLISADRLTLERLLLFASAWVLGTYHAIQGLPGIERHYHAHLDPNVVAALVTVFFGLMLLVSLRKLGRLGQMNWTVLGALTYPLYLFHQVCGYIIFNHLYPKVEPTLLLVCTVLFMLCMAYIVHAQVERRFAGRFKAALNRLMPEPAAKAGATLQQASRPE